MALASALRGYAHNVRQIVKDLLQSGKWPQRPDSINFEITAACDAKCIHCPRQDMDRSQGKMNMVLFKKMVDEAAEMKVPELCPNGYGEILLLKNAHEYLSYISSKSHPFRIVINTNGHLMTDEKIETFLDHRVYLLNITLDGATAKTAESIRVGLSLDQIEDNIRRFFEARARRKLTRPKVRVGMILIPQNMHEKQAFLDKWQGKADYVGFGGFTDRAGSVHVGQSGDGEYAKACVLPFRDLSIWADGKAVLCCDDWNEEHVMGDLNTQSLREIWNGAIFAEARRLHRAGKGGELSVCSKCRMWRPPSAGARLWS